MYISGLFYVVKMNVTSHLNNKDESNHPGQWASLLSFLWWYLAGYWRGNGQTSLNSHLMLVTGMTAFFLISVSVFTHTSKTQVT